MFKAISGTAFGGARLTRTSDRQWNDQTWTSLSKQTL